MPGTEGSEPRPEPVIEDGLFCRAYEERRERSFTERTAERNGNEARREREQVAPCIERLAACSLG
jgi:hypothetical protein